MTDWHPRLWAFAPLLGVAIIAVRLTAQHAGPAAPPDKAAAVPQLIDITASTGIHFKHLSSLGKKYIVESMRGGVALIDYDRDGWPDIYFTNAPDVDMQLAGKKARSALFRNNHHGGFIDVTEDAGVGHPCCANGAVVGEFNNDSGRTELLTNLEADRFYCVKEGAGVVPCADIWPVASPRMK